MRALNLILEREQKASRRGVLVVIFLNFMIWFFFIALTVGIVLLWGKFIMEHKLAEIQERSILVRDSRLTLGNEIRAINAQVSEIDKVQTGFIQWSHVVSELSSQIPVGNSLTTMQFDINTLDVLIAGQSLTRFDLLALEKKLKSSPYLTDIKSPLSNLLFPFNIAFTFSAKLNLEL